jgi:TetR/AcrR family transcriptional regulator, regulator of cefoperazone and chloramphenicol sensitivity
MSIGTPPVRPSTPPPKAGDRAREHLLEVAGEVFAEKGYDRATSKEICERAGVNSSAVNYYFGGIDKLYVAALARAHGRMSTLEDLKKIASADVPAQDKLRSFLAPLIKWLAHPSAKSWEMQLFSREIVAPSPLQDAFFETEIQPKLHIFRGIIAGIIGARPDEAVVGRAILTVIAPVFFLVVANRVKLENVLPALADPETEIERLIEHYERFIGAGLEAVAQDYRLQTRKSVRAAAKSVRR